MNEIANMIKQLHKEYADIAIEVKTLANESQINCIRLGELCDKMIFILRTVLVLDEIHGRGFDSTLPQCN